MWAWIWSLTYLDLSGQLPPVTSQGHWWDELKKTYLLCVTCLPCKKIPNMCHFCCTLLQNLLGCTLHFLFIIFQTIFLLLLLYHWLLLTNEYPVNKWSSKIIVNMSRTVYDVSIASNIHVETWHRSVSYVFTIAIKWVMR